MVISSSILSIEKIRGDTFISALTRLDTVITCKKEKSAYRVCVHIRGLINLQAIV